MSHAKLAKAQKIKRKLLAADGRRLIKKYLRVSGANDIAKVNRRERRCDYG